MNDMTNRKYPKNSAAEPADLGARPAVTPAYFRGRPATAWLAVFGNGRRGRRTAAGGRGRRA
jgi:hypothetical protein